ncbi:MAG: response regulator transcription factor [Myxococcota bacterium]|jgi:two-component system response regulator RstA
MESEPSIFLLLVEDDVRLAALTKEYLEHHNVVCSVAHDGQLGLQDALRHRFDVILLDIMLPGMNGIEVCKRLRQHSDVPIIMITARDEEADRVMGLELGADDYIPKPFSARELLARIKAIVRRARGMAGPNRRIVSAGSLNMDPGSLDATYKNRPLDLTPYEFSLLYALAGSSGRILSREQIMDRVKGACDEAFDRSIDVHISRLRRKLGDDTHKPRIIKTVRGLGYQYVTEEEQ